MTIEKNDFENNCHTKWGKKPYWGLELHHMKGEIIKVNDDESYDIKYHHPLDGYATMNRTATVTKLECSAYWMAPEQKEKRINRARNTLKVGDQVTVNTYRSLFYIYTWKQMYDWSMAHLGKVRTYHKFVSGDPHLGYKQEIRIDVA